MAKARGFNLPIGVVPFRFLFNPPHSHSKVISYLTIIVFWRCWHIVMWRDLGLGASTLLWLLVSSASTVMFLSSLFAGLVQSSKEWHSKMRAGILLKCDQNSAKARELWEGGWNHPRWVDAKHSLTDCQYNWVGQSKIQIVNLGLKQRVFWVKFRILLPT